MAKQNVGIEYFKTSRCFLDTTEHKIYSVPQLGVFTLWTTNVDIF